ncbi:MAG: HAD-IB family phosphatase [Akkermansiaceae bacterium]
MNPPRRLEVSIDEQTLNVIEGGQCIRQFRVSTAVKGMGFTKDTYRTPIGRFRVCEKIGEGAASGTIFKKRLPAGQWAGGDGAEEDLVLTRILRLEGLDSENANTLERHIYIHATNREDKLGEPASQGCVRLDNAGMIELFDMVSEGVELVIQPATRQRGKLLFIDCDSTLSSIEGIDELARAKGAQVFAQVVALTEAAMNGEIAIGEVFPRRMEMIGPDREVCEKVADLYVRTVVPGVTGLIEDVKRAGWTPVILSGGFAPLIHPLARVLGIDHVEAVPLFFDAEGRYIDYGRDYPTTRNLGKNEVIREWRDALLPERVVMIGDGVSDLETKPDVDVFIGFGGVVERPLVRQGADYWFTDMLDRAELLSVIEGELIEDPTA